MQNEPGLCFQNISDYYFRVCSFVLLLELDILDVNLLATVATLEFCVVLFVECVFVWEHVVNVVVALNIEYCLHRFVVCDADWVRTLHDVLESFWQTDFALLLNLIVLDYGEADVRADHCELTDFCLVEELVGNLNESLSAHDVAVKVVTDEYRFREFVKSEELNDCEEFVCWYVVDD